MSETLEDQTARIRKKYAFSSAGDRIHRTEQYFAEFDAWLSAVQDAAWERGHDAAQ